MQTARDVLAQKGGVVHSISPQATVLEAALRMNEYKIGFLMVLQEGTVVGVFSERDILTRIVAARRDPAQTRVGEVMTRDIIACSPDTPLDEMRTVFRNRKIRHLPVIDSHKTLLGVVSIGDLNTVDAVLQETHIHYLQAYIHGQI